MVKVLPAQMEPLLTVITGRGFTVTETGNLDDTVDELLAWA